MTDYAQLAHELREVVRLRDFYIAMVRAGTTGAKVGPHIRAYEDAAAKACDNPALLELAEAAERGPVAYTDERGIERMSEGKLEMVSKYKQADDFTVALYALTGPKDQT